LVPPVKSIFNNIIENLKKNLRIKENISAILKMRITRLRLRLRLNRKLPWEETFLYLSPLYNYEPLKGG
jgi:hypothetical protein